MKHKIEYIKRENLVLDSHNPRFADLYSGTTQKEIILYLLNEENAHEIVDNILDKHEYYPDEALWVIKRNDGSYLVKEGNRRAAAVVALSNPDVFGLNVGKFDIQELPAIIYDDERLLEKRIREKHATPSFRAWSRIAKALEIHRLFVAGASSDEIQAIDSNVGDFMKIANFYYEAVKHGGEKFKELVRSSGKKGGKLAFLERLFRSRKSCGYDFGGKSEKYKLIITDNKLFKQYIDSVVEYLQTNPDASYYDVDKLEQQQDFLRQIGITETGCSQPELGLKFNSKNESNLSIEKEKKYDGILPDFIAVPEKGADSHKNKSLRGSVQRKPVLTRKNRSKSLEYKIDELFIRLNSQQVPNAKMAMIRIVFECTLKWVLDNTKYQDKKLSSYEYFNGAFITKKGNKKPFTDFAALSELFAKLISDVSMKRAFSSFNIDNIQQIIHNDKVSATPSDCDTFVANLSPLIEFMLQDEAELLKKLDLKSLK